MNRNLKTDSIILRTRRIGELHRGLSCLTRYNGIIEVMAYGAGKGKSKLSGLVDPFSILFLYLYFDPVRDSYKVSDIEQKMIFPDIRHDLVKFYIASFWAELILKSFSGGGESEAIFPLLGESLKILNETDKKKQILIQFIWRYLDISGFRMDIDYCGKCNTVFSELEKIWFDDKETQLICSSCRTDTDLLQFPNGGLKYLRHTSSLNLNKSMRIGLDSSSADVLIRILSAMVQGIVEYPLNTLKKGLLYHS